MPIYEYTCRSCEHPFEELVLGSETPSCPECASEELEQRFSTFAVSDTSPRVGMSPMPMPASGACGSCGDPRGPGSCSLD